MAQQFPQKLIAGDTLKLSILSPTYTDADGFEVVVSLNGPSGSPIPYSYSTTVNGNAFDLLVPALETSGYQAGRYSYAIVAVKQLLPSGTEEYTIEYGVTEVAVRADLNFDQDLRTHAEKVLDAIEAVIEGRASKDQESYTISGRTLQRTPLRDLLNLRKYYKDQVATEKGTARSKLKIWMR